MCMLISLVVAILLILKEYFILNTVTAPAYVSDSDVKIKYPISEAEQFDRFIWMVCMIIYFLIMLFDSLLMEFLGNLFLHFVKFLRKML